MKFGELAATAKSYIGVQKVMERLSQNLGLLWVMGIQNWRQMWLRGISKMRFNMWMNRVEFKVAEKCIR